jgi:hypothetical protein
MAIAMFTRGDMTVVSTARWESLMALYQRMLMQVGSTFSARCTTENVLGKNGWQCCQCGGVNMDFWILIGLGRSKCGRCGHSRCGEVSTGGEDFNEGK